MKTHLYTLTVSHLATRDPATVTVHRSRAEAEAVYRDNFDGDPDASVEDDAADQGVNVSIEEHEIDLSRRTLIVIEPNSEAMRWLHRAVTKAVETERKVSLAVDEGHFKVKVGEDVWTAQLDTGQPSLPGFE